MIIFLHGPDSYRSRQRLKFYREGFKKKYDPQGLNIEVLEGEKLKLEEFRNKLGNQGLLVKKRLVIVEELIGKNKAKKIQEEITAYLKENRLSEDEILIFWEEDLSGGWSKGKKKSGATGKLVKYLQKEAKMEEFELLTGHKLSAWAEREFNKKRGRIEKPALNLLVALVGSNLWQMNNEIEKLINYKKGKIIDKEDVSMFVKAKYDTDVFKLTDMIAEKKGKAALKLIRDQIMSGENELYLLAMLTRLFRILVQVKEVSKEENNHYTIASRLKLHPFVAQKSLAQVNNFTLNELKEIYGKLLEIDLKIKTSQTDPRVLFDLFMLETMGLT